jgi:mRNA-degrading endonuclease toxin of MazEF toxin-antitoxin module
MSFDLDNMYCGALRRGDVVLYFEENKKKEFPAVVLQDNMLNQGLPTVICARIEPFKKGEEVFINEVMLKKEESGLGKEGVCMLHRLFTIDRRNILAKKAELPDLTIKSLYKAIDVTLGRFRDKK